MKYTDPDWEIIIIGALTLIGAYMGGVATNSVQLNPRQWNWNSPATYFGVIGGGLLGYVGGWYMFHGGNLGLAAGISTPAGRVYLTGQGSNWSFQWTTTAGGSGGIPIAGNKAPSAAQLVNNQIQANVSQYRKYFTSSNKYVPYNIEVGHLNLLGIGPLNYFDPRIVEESWFDAFSDVEFVYDHSSKLTLGVQAGGNLGVLGGKYGVFGNIFSLTLLEYNSNEGFTSMIHGRNGYMQINQTLSGGYFLGGTWSHTFDTHGSGYKNDNYSYQFGAFLNKKGTPGFSYNYNTNNSKPHSIDLSIEPKIGLILGFEGIYRFRLKW